MPGLERAYGIGLGDPHLGAERAQVGRDAATDGTVAQHERGLIAERDPPLLEQVGDREDARLAGAVAVVEHRLGARR